MVSHSSNFPHPSNYLNCFVRALYECDILVLWLVELMTEFKLNGKSLLERSDGYIIITSVHLWVLDTKSLYVIFEDFVVPLTNQE